MSGSISINPEIISTSTRLVTYESSSNAEDLTILILSPLAQSYETKLPWCDSLNSIVDTSMFINHVLLDDTQLALPI